MDYGTENTDIIGDTPVRDGSTVYAGDVAAACELHRAFANQGWEIPQGKIRNVAEGGSILDDQVTGSATSASASHLVDSGASFITGHVKVGYTVNNTDDTTSALVTNVTATDLTLDADIFPLGSEAYSIEVGYESQIDVLRTMVTRPDVCIMQMGTNDAASAIIGTWEADYQVHIDRLIAAGARIIILINVITRNTDPAFRSATYEARVDELNVIHQNLVDANTECHLVDAFNIIGGHNGWSEDDVNQSTPTHLNDQGYTKILNGVFNVLQPLIASL